ncbi:MAG TPA: hypothetical protein VHP33_26195 [Polyangiaceae bacterium]|nr:hypothetical protein [Polyangiaceae bacterium]
MRWLGWLGVGFAALGVVTAAAPARAQQAPAGEAKAEARERAALLAQVLPDAVRMRSLVALPPLMIAVGGTMGALGVAGRWPLAVVGGAVALGGGVGFYLMPEQRNYELLSATASASSGLFYLSFPLSEPHTRWQVPLGASYLAMSALGFVNLAYSTQPGRSRLRRDLDRVRTPAARSSLSVAELRQIERDLYDTDPFIPQWALGLPLAVGGIIASAPVFDSDVAARDKPLIGAIAGLTLLQGVVISFVQTPAMRYRTSLENAGLHVSWGVGPGGVSVSGSFD